MAEEISTTLVLEAKKGGADVSFSKLVRKFTMAGADMVKGPTLITTAEMALPVNGMTAPVGTLAVFNMDAANYVEFSTGTGATFDAQVFCKLLPGKPALWYPALAAAINCRAHTAAVRIEVCAVAL